MKTFLRKCLVLIAMLAPLCGVNAKEKTVTFGASTDKPSSGLTYTKDGVTISATGGTLNNGSEYRIFKNQTLTISSESTITKIEMTCTASGTAQYGPGCFTTNKETYSYSGNKGTWSNETGVNEVSFTASTNQVRITSLTVTLQDDSRTPTTLTFDQENFEFLQGDMGGGDFQQLSNA